MKQLTDIITNVALVVFTLWAMVPMVIAAASIVQDYRHRKRKHVLERMLANGFAFVFCMLAVFFMLHILFR